MALYKNKYRVESTRLKDWDYSSDGCYFVTIATKNRECVMGEIVEGRVRLSEIGKIVSEEWQKTEEMRIGIQLDEWVIMPNHLHGIILILNNDPVETHCNASPSGKNNLSNIIRGFKAASATRIHHAGYKNFRWQSRFYDHIVGTEEAFQKVREYIGDNPLKWDLDNENPEVIKKGKMG